jgi:hypothetical protein
VLFGAPSDRFRKREMFIIIGYGLPTISKQVPTTHLAQPRNTEEKDEYGLSLTFIKYQVM